MAANRMSAAQAANVKAEHRRRQVAKLTLLNAAFGEQRAFIEDPERFKVALCTRRAGKSYGIGLYLFREAILNPGVNCLYLARTRQSAKDMMFKDVFRQINDKYNLGARYNFVDLTITMPNGSVIHIAGADATAGQMHKVVGKKYRLVVIDECQYWSNNLWRLIKEGLEATLIDNEGTICLMGVPSAARAFFFEVSTKAIDPKTGDELHPGWSIHKWSARDNPHMKARWDADLRRMLQTDPKFTLTPTFRQQYLGEWVDDPDARCYRFDAEGDTNRVKVLPDNVGDYTWLLGVDVGFSPDPMAFVVVGYKTDWSDRCLYVVHVHKEVEMMLDDVKAYVDELQLTWPITEYVIDGANTNVFSELTKRLGIPFTAAKKQGKSEFIHLVTDDLMCGRVKVVGDECEDLPNEWMKLMWDRTVPSRPVPNEACEDHLSDAFLYAWRYCYHYLRPQNSAPTEPVRGSDGWMATYEKRLQERLKQSYDQAKAIEREFGGREDVGDGWGT